MEATFCHQMLLPYEACIKGLNILDKKLIKLGKNSTLTGIIWSLPLAVPSLQPAGCIIQQVNKFLQ